MEEYTIVLSDNSLFSLSSVTLQKYPTISNILADLEQKENIILLPYDDPPALKIVLTEDFVNNSYAMDVFIRLLKAINYLGDDNTLQLMINKMKNWPNNKQMVQQSQGLSVIIKSHLQTLPSEIIYDLLELQIIDRYTIPLGLEVVDPRPPDLMEFEDVVRIYGNNRGDTLITINNGPNGGAYDVLLVDGQTARTTSYNDFFETLHEEIISIADDGQINIVYFTTGEPYNDVTLNITITKEDTLAYGTIDKTGNMQSTILGKLENLTAKNADNIDTQLSADGSRIYIAYFIKSEDESVPGKFYYKIINSTSGQLLWSGFTEESLIITPSTAIIFPSPQLTAVIVHRRGSGKYTINLSDGRSITISNPQITGMFIGPSPDLNVPTILTYDINNILFSPRETHLLETTAIGRPPAMPSIVPITDPLEVGPVTEQNKFYTSRLITIEGQILLTHQFDKTWPIALGQNYIITKDVIDDELVLRIWPIYYSVDNNDHITYGIDKEKVLFQKKGMDLLSIHATTNNIVNIVYRASDEEFMKDTIDT